MTRTLIVTRSESRYVVEERRNGEFWLSGNNIPSGTSCPIIGEWQIAQPDPWPPVVGQSILLVAPPWMDQDDPNRIPGGGKITSPVKEVL